MSLQWLSTLLYWGIHHFIYLVTTHITFKDNNKEINNIYRYSNNTVIIQNKGIENCLINNKNEELYREVLKTNL